MKLDGKYYNTLDIEGFSHMMKDPSYCYKFYWLEAIVQLIAEGVKETTFDAVIDEMICNAWYSVREFHIHLSGMPIDGQVKDGLERAVSKLSELSNLPANASKVEIKNAIKKYALELKTSKEQLTNMVPYRALAGFFDRAEEPADWGSVRRMTEYIERINEHVVILPYTLGTGSKLKKRIPFRKLITFRRIQGRIHRHQIPKFIVHDKRPWNKVIYIICFWRDNFSGKHVSDFRQFQNTLP